MIRYLVRRITFGFFTVVGATIIVFFLSRAAGDPRYTFIGETGYGISEELWDRVGRELALDKPVVVQYAFWLGHVLRGDFGKSITTQKPVVWRIRETIGATVQLSLGAWLFGTLVGVPLGVYSATHRGKFLDYVGRIFALLGQSLPIFWTGIMGIFVFSVLLGWLPSGTRGEGIPIRNLILPSITLGWFPAAGYLRLTRSAMLEALDSEYIKFAKAKGVTELWVIWKHAFRNAIIIPITYSALLFINFLTGMVVTETVFSWPGIGRLVVTAVRDNDFPILSALVLVFAVLYVGVMLILDILYGMLDPRIRHE